MAARGQIIIITVVNQRLDRVGFGLSSHLGVSLCFLSSRSLPRKKVPVQVNGTLSTHGRTNCGENWASYEKGAEGFFWATVTNLPPSQAFSMAAKGVNVWQLHEKKRPASFSRDARFSFRRELTQMWTESHWLALGLFPGRTLRGKEARQNA